MNRTALKLLLLLASLPSFACVAVSREVVTTPSGPAGRQVVSSRDAPAAIGPYSQAILTGETLWVSGQIGLDPVTGDLVPGGVEAESRQVLENLRAVLAAAGFLFEDAVLVNVFLADLRDLEIFNRICAETFPTAPPARVTIEASALPRGARVEVALTAVRSRRS